MRKTMQRAESPDQVYCMNAYNMTLRKQLAQDTQRTAVLWVIEGRNKDNVVGNVEIGITGGQADASKKKRGGHGDINNRQGLSPIQTYTLKAFTVFFQSAVIIIVGILFPTQNDRCGIHETTNIVHMSMGVIAGNPVSQPKHLLYTQMALENFFIIILCESGISGLDIFSQQAFFRGDQDAAPIGVYGTAFQNDMVPLMLHRLKRIFQVSGNVRGPQGIQCMVGIFGPTGKTERHGRRLSGWCHDKKR